MQIQPKISIPTKKHSTNYLRLGRRLQRETGKAIADYRMIADGDVVMVCLSGGKDSFTMLHLLRELQKRAPIQFELIPMNLDQKQPGFPHQKMAEYLDGLGLPFHIEVEDTFSIVREKIPSGKTTCSLCSRLRRGILYRVARQLGANKIALGHHLDDIVETFFLNIFFAGKLKAMPPKLINDAKDQILIRPLAYCREKDIARFARATGFPLIPCNLCGSQENAQRQQIKHMLGLWEQTSPERTQNLFRALQHVVPSHLADFNLYDFANLEASLSTSK